MQGLLNTVSGKTKTRDAYDIRSVRPIRMLNMTMLSKAIKCTRKFRK
jgi:hypothetical protein